MGFNPGSNGALSSATDVAFNSLQNEEVLTYDTTAAKWQNAASASGATDLSVTTAASTMTVNSSTGANATLPAATTTVAGVFTGADKTKLNGIASGATANATDAQLRDRTTHTGTQAISTVTGLQTALDSKAAVNASGDLVRGGNIMAMSYVKEASAPVPVDLPIGTIVVNVADGSL